LANEVESVLRIYLSHFYKFLV